MKILFSLFLRILDLFSLNLRIFFFLLEDSVGHVPSPMKFIMLVVAEKFCTKLSLPKSLSLKQLKFESETESPKS